LLARHNLESLIVELMLNSIDAIVVGDDLFGKLKIWLEERSCCTAHGACDERRHLYECLIDGI
jgi:hypothetical protein